MASISRYRISHQGVPRNVTRVTFDQRETKSMGKAAEALMQARRRLDPDSPADVLIDERLAAVEDLLGGIFLNEGRVEADSSLDDK